MQEQKPYPFVRKMKFLIYSVWGVELATKLANICFSMTVAGVDFLEISFTSEAVFYLFFSFTLSSIKHRYLLTFPSKIFNNASLTLKSQKDELLHFDFFFFLILWNRWCVSYR